MLPAQLCIPQLPIPLVPATAGEQSPRSGYGRRTESEYEGGGNGSEYGRRKQSYREEGEGYSPTPYTPGSGYGGRTKSEIWLRPPDRIRSYGEEGEDYGRRHEVSEHGSGGYRKRHDDDDDDESRSRHIYGHDGDEEGHGRRLRSATTEAAQIYRFDGDVNF
ncbi:hypothetical protein LINPERHAP2_LOCUS29935 [Linum perenne]